MTEEKAIEEDIEEEEEEIPSEPKKYEPVKKEEPKEIRAIWYKDNKDELHCKRYPIKDDEYKYKLTNMKETDTLYRLKGTTGKYYTEYSDSSTSRWYIEDKKVSWERTGYYRKVIIQKRKVSPWEDDE